jgi:hypothetical protein
MSSPVARTEARRKRRTLAGNYQLLAMEPRLLVPVINPVWLQYISHKVGRESSRTREPHEGEIRMSNRRIAIIVGALFFVQLLTFMLGSSLIRAFLDGGGGRVSLTVGVLLEMCAGVAVVAIGLLMYRVLKTVDAKLALGYPIMRVAEFAVSAVLAIYLLTQLQEFPNHLLCVYIPTGIGGLILNYLLFRSRMVSACYGPPWV